MSSVPNKQILIDLFAELTNYDFADSLKRHQRDEQGEYATAWEVVRSEIGDSLADGGNSFDPSDFGIKTPYPSEIKDKRDYQKLLMRLAGAMHQRIINGGRFEEELSSAKSFLGRLLDSNYSSTAKAVTLPDTAIATIPPYLLSEAWEDFKKFKSDWNHDIKLNNQRLYEIMLAYWGDIDVKTINRPMIKSLLSRYKDFPKGNILPYKKMEIAQIMDIDEEDIPDEDKVSSKTVNGLLKVCQSFFSRFLTNEKEIYQISPTTKVDWPSKSTGYACFSDSQIIKLKQAAVKLEGWHKWTILLAIYTGARRGDIVGLTHESLRLDDDTGRYYLWINSGKTVAAIRPIPIHNRLIELGFIEFVKGVEGELFPVVFNHHNSLTYHARGLMDNLDIPSANEKGERFSLHRYWQCCLWVSITFKFAFLTVLVFMR